MKQHKWHKEIKAWADGAEIEFKVGGEGEWMLLKGTPYWECKNDLFRIKPQPKEKHFKCNGFCGYYECNEIQARDSNLCKRVTDWKPQPKEPQYLYVYQDVSIDANNYLLRTSFIEEPNVAIYIGKIKLEDTE